MAKKAAEHPAKKAGQKSAKRPARKSGRRIARAGTLVGLSSSLALCATVLAVIPAARTGAMSRDGPSS